MEVKQGQILRSTFEMVALKIGGILLALMGSVFYARVLGPDGYGLYSFVLATVAIVTIPASLGLPNYLIREGAKTVGSLGWMIRWADRHIVFSGLAMAAILLLALVLPVPEKTRWLFVLASPLPLLNNLSAVRTSLLQARSLIITSQWPQLLLSPIITLTVLGAFWLVSGSLAPEHLVAMVTVTAAIIFVLKSHQAGRIAGTHPPESGHSPLSILTSLPLMWLATLYLLNSRIDLLIVTKLSGEHEAGLYAIGARTAELITLISAAANMHLAPKIARLYHRGETDNLQRLLRKTAARYLVATSPLVILFLAFGKPIIVALYGIAYSGSTDSLQILACAQFGFLIFGSVGTILIMTDNIRHCLRGIGIAVAANIVLNLALVPEHGATGAAVATGISLVLGQGLLWLSIRKYTGLRSSAMGF
ncbi:flippase [Cognatiluteimonas weifangensis]|nr:flippase [Luteimonas weifangensis]